MEIIRVWNQRVFDFLGYQHITDEPLRFNQYCISHQIDDGILIFNGITNELLLVSIGEELTFAESEYAMQHWFTVPLWLNEQNLIIQLRDKLKREESQTKITKYTIFTTTACNAHCYYCFENGQRSGVFMDANVAQQLSQRIISNTAKDDWVELAWFGGEPLLNADVIDCICTQLKQRGIHYFSTMASNAFLFTPALIKKAKELWCLRDMQVTLDGTAQFYNLTKNYFCDRQTNAFRVVWENIKSLTESGIFVAIKLNISHDNKDVLLHLVDDLENTFYSNDCIGVHCACLFGIDDASNSVQIIEQSRELYKIQLEVLEKIYCSSLYRFGLSSCLRIYHCNPDAGREITILPDGKIGWCEHYLESNFIGDVWSFDLDSRKISSLKTRYDDLDECRVCTMYPNCIRLKICDASTEWCIEEKRQCMLKETKMQMQYEYKLFKKNQCI